MTVLSQRELDKVVSMSEEGASLREIADAFDVSIPTVRKILDDYERGGEQDDNAETVGDDGDDDEDFDDEDPDDGDDLDELDEDEYAGGRLTFVGVDEDDDEDEWDSD